MYGIYNRGNNLIRIFSITISTIDYLDFKNIEWIFPKP